jgi:hypothetical protein
MSMMSMIQSRLLAAVIWAAAATCSARGMAAEYQAVRLEKAPPKEELAPAIAESLQPAGIAFMRGENRTVCELWLCKKWEVQPDFKPTLQLLYPFKEGELVGVIRYPRWTRRPSRSTRRA